ncbi:MAG: lactate utilization protein [Candidatus Rokubacteria bacterium]|nr:lactate utilization protein [Candidatus Rokubacteria bacterium]
MTTRAQFLDRIRAEMGKTRGSFPSRVSERPARPVEAADIIRRQLAERWPDTLERFRTEFERVGGVFHRVATASDIPRAVGAIARERDARDLVAWHAAGIGADVEAGLVSEGLAVRAVSLGATDAERRELRAASATAALGLTGVDLAIAEMGTMVLRSGAGRPRSTSLLPPCHVAVFDPSVLVESLEQAGVFLEAWHAEGGDWGAMINFITGPSRTADIELTLTRGVHGPKEVHAVFVEGGLRG